MDYGILSILPPLIAILFAIRTKQVLISLFAGIYVAEFILSNYHPLVAMMNSVNRVIVVFSQAWVTKTIFFAFLIGAVISLVQASGGVQGFINFLTIKTKMVRNRKSAMMLAYVIGLIIFIESSITILISGIVARPVTDKYRVSREKLAYICDSTSASVCGLIPLNGWGATLIGLIGVQISSGIIQGNAADILIRSLPYQFYSILAILFVLYYIKTGRDWGPMKKAEIRAINTGMLLPEGAVPLASKDTTDVAPKTGVKPQTFNMLIPILTLIVLMPINLMITGKGNIMDGDGATSVLWAVLASLTVSFLLYKSQKIFSISEFMNITYKGIGGMIPVASILIFAFAIGQSIADLGTGAYLASLVENSIHGAFGPAIIFILGCGIAFATGTSWGTFAILIPISIQMATALELNIPLTVGAVVSGAIMGDHCSPISDTTILASMASASDHIDHVKTQLPYALLAATIALILYILMGFATT